MSHHGPRYLVSAISTMGPLPSPNALIMEEVRSASSSQSTQHSFTSQGPFSNLPFSAQSYPATCPLWSFWFLNLLPTHHAGHATLLLICPVQEFPRFIHQMYWGPTRCPALCQTWVLLSANSSLSLCHSVFMLWCEFSAFYGEVKGALWGWTLPLKKNACALRQLSL